MAGYPATDCFFNAMEFVGTTLYLFFALLFRVAKRIHKIHSALRVYRTDAVDPRLETAGSEKSSAPVTSVFSPADADQVW
jgi:hypothetical protein